MKSSISKFRRNVIAGLASLSLAASCASVTNATFSSKMCTFSNVMGFFKDVAFACGLGYVSNEALTNSNSVKNSSSERQISGYVGFGSLVLALDKCVSAAGRVFSIPRDMNTTDALNDYNDRAKMKKQFGGNGGLCNGIVSNMPMQPNMPMPMQPNMNVGYSAMQPNMNMGYPVAQQNMNYPAGQNRPMLPSYPNQMNANQNFMIKK